jgi:hypothetical protein
MTSTISTTARASSAVNANAGVANPIAIASTPARKLQNDIIRKLP